MSNQFPVKVGEEVIVIAGKHKHGNKNGLASSGKVTSVDRSTSTVTVEGLNIQKKAVRKSEANAEGGWLQQEGPIAVSNVMGKAEFDARRAKKAK
jgi:large subunit ribosomal protein L24